MPTDPVATAAQQRLDAVIAHCKEQTMWGDLQALNVRALAEGKSVEQMQAEWEAEDGRWQRAISVALVIAWVVLGVVALYGAWFW